MKITKMRYTTGEKLHENMVDVVFELKRRFKRAGFITGVEVVNSQSIKIGLHMCSFRIDTNVHDRNLRFNPHLGAKLTTTPTWQQRVEFNNIVNAVLTKYRVSAKVTSGPFIIREGMKRYEESDWVDQKPAYITHNESRGYYVESCDEREFLEERRLERNRLACERRRLLKQKAAEVRFSIVQGAHNE